MKRFISFHAATFEFTVYDETTILVIWEQVHGKTYNVFACDEDDREGGRHIQVQMLPNKSNSLRIAKEFAKTIFE